MRFVYISLSPEFVVQACRGVMMRALYATVVLCVDLGWSPTFFGLTRGGSARTQVTPFNRD